MIKTKNTNNPVREIRGNLDSRTGEEQELKGNDTTHNRMENHVNKEQHHKGNKEQHNKKKDTAITHLNRKRNNSHASGL